MKVDHSASRWGIYILICIALGGLLGSLIINKADPNVIYQNSLPPYTRFTNVLYIHIHWPTVYVQMEEGSATMRNKGVPLTTIEQEEFWIPAYSKDGDHRLECILSDGENETSALFDSVFSGYTRIDSVAIDSDVPSVTVTLIEAGIRKYEVVFSDFDTTSLSKSKRDYRYTIYFREIGE